MKPITVLITIFLLVISASIVTTRIVKSVQFEQECGGHLKRAADANTIELAKSELDKAVQYIEANNLTKGYTSAIYNTPDEDLGFWYINLKESQRELEEMPKDASIMDKTNTLMKLRETLLDNGSSKSDSITIPKGISVFPNNFAWGIAVFLSVLVFIVGILALAVWLES